MHMNNKMLFGILQSINNVCNGKKAYFTFTLSLKQYAIHSNKNIGFSKNLVISIIRLIHKTENKRGVRGNPPVRYEDCQPNEHAADTGIEPG